MLLTSKGAQRGYLCDNVDAGLVHLYKGSTCPRDLSLRHNSPLFFQEITTFITMSFSPTLRSGAVGFMAGALIPILVTNLYLIPHHQYQEKLELNWLKHSVGLMNWQVSNLERKSSGHRLLDHESYRDGLYWAGF